MNIYWKVKQINWPDSVIRNDDERFILSHDEFFDYVDKFFMQEF